MTKSIFYKEWLKIRWAVLASVLVFFCMLAYIYLNTSYYMRFMDPNGMWYNVVIRGVLFYGDLFIYIPVFAGILIGTTQFVPEISANRLKLTLHLPMKENMLLFWMLFVGTVVLLILFIFAYILLGFISLNFFPVEVLHSVIITSLPWFLAGFVTYWSVSMIAIELLWKKRVILMVIYFGFVNLLLYLNFYNTYENSLIIFLFLSIFFAFQNFLTTYRFRKGVI